MKIETRPVNFYIADDGKEFNDENSCINHEIFMQLVVLHKKLIDFNFYSRFKIVPYFHNVKIENLSNKRDLFKTEKGGSFILMTGRMGNGNDIVRLKVEGQKIKLLKFNTDNNISEKDDYLGHFPFGWIYLSHDELESAVDLYISKRRVYITETEIIIKKKQVEI